MRILFLVHAFNSLAQRLHVEMRERGHEVCVEFDINDAVTDEAVRLARPDLVLAPFLKRAIPPSVHEQCLCLVVHPGPPGDGGPAALDHAILDRRAAWGVTVLQATAELDAGPVWAHEAFPLRQATKSSLYRHEVTEAAVRAVLAALRRVEAGEGPLPDQPARRDWRGPVDAKARTIDWARDDPDAVLRTVAAADGMPGARALLAGREMRLFDAAAAPGLAGEPGTLLCRAGDDIAVAVRAGAVWIGRIADPASPAPFKLPAVRVLGPVASSLPELPPDHPAIRRRIAFRDLGAVGILTFDIHNGAFSADVCRMLLDALRQALAAPNRVLVLAGGPDHWSNGLDLNDIEAAASPADASLANIEAMNDLSAAIIRATDRIVIAAVGGNAGAGGVFLARAADEVWLARACVLNPHYKDMGNLYGSEHWTYLLPKHAGDANARRIAAQRLPMGAAEALRVGLADRIIDAGREAFPDEAVARALALAADPALDARIAAKAASRAADEAVKPLDAWRAEEIARMKRNFYGFDPSYHVARSNFVRKVAKSRTPAALATHRGPNPGPVTRR